MDTKPILYVELALGLAALAFAVAWQLDPAQNLEPTIAVLTVAIAGLELARRFVRSSQLRVFLSVGTTYTPEQEAYVRELEFSLERLGCKPETVGRSRQRATQPMHQVRSLMRRADAVIVVAFPRTRITQLIDKPGSPSESRKRNLLYPTVWNQIEAGIAFGLGRPLLLVLDESIEHEAMLKDRQRFRAVVGSLSAEFVRGSSFQGCLEDFVGIARSVIAEAFSNRVITPGATTTDDVAAYLRQRFEDLGLGRLGPAVGDVVADRPVEQERVLLDDSQ